MLAPIVIFVYNRPWHTQQTLESLFENDLANQSTLYIYADGPKINTSEEALQKIKEVRNIIREKKWCKEVIIIESDKNKGLENSIVEGITDIVNKYGKIIVLEDDMLTSKGFLRYMNDALNLYENEERVMHISGYMFPVKSKLPETFFYNATSCWGWATWKRAWKYFNPDAKQLFDQLKNSKLIKKFNVEGSYDYYLQLKYNAEGKIKTWAIKWYATIFLKKGFCLHPNKSLVNNIGFDNTGDHCGITDKFKWEMLADSIIVEPIEIKESIKARKSIIRFLLYTNKVSIIDKIKKIIPYKIKNYIKMLINIHLAFI